MATTEAREVIDKGVALLRSKEPEKALDLLLRAAEAGATDPALHYWIAVCELALGAASKAIQTLTGLLRQHPKDVRALHLLGSAYERIGALESARARYEQVLRIQPDNAQVAKDLGRVRGSSAPAPARTAPPPRRPRPSAAAPTAAPAVTPAAPIAPSDASLAGRLRREDGGAAFGDVEWTLRRRLTSHPVSWLGLLAIVAGFVVAQQRRPDEELLALLFVGGVLLMLLGIVSASRQRCTRYRYALVFDCGILFRTEKCLWLYEIEHVALTRNPLQLLLGTATAEFVGGTRMGKNPEKTRAISIGRVSKVRAVCEELRTASVRERRDMKHNFI